MGLTIPLYGGGYEFYTGSLVAGNPIPFTVSLDGTDYAIDLKQYRRNGLDTLRAGTVNSTEPNDELFDPQGAWFRYRYSFDHGQGQAVADLTPDADARRFLSSYGIDPWDRFAAELLPSTSLVLAASADTLPMIATGTLVYLGDGTGVKRSPDLTTWSSVTGLSGTVNAITTDGTDVYIATTTDIFRVTPASLAASAIGDTAGTPAFDNIAFVSNRLLASAAAELWEIGVTATTPIFTHFQAAFRWTTIINVGSRIYAGGFAGNRSELYAIQALEDGSLARAQEAAPFAYGELLRAALAYGGAVVLCTSLGVRFAQIGGDGILTYGPLITDSGDTRCATAEGRFAWFGWSVLGVASGSGVGRMALDQFVEALQPAYARDVYTNVVADDVWSTARFGGRTLFAVSGAGIYASSLTAFVTTGYIDTGLVYFGTVEVKRATDLAIATALLAASEGVAVEVSDQNGDSLGSGSVATVGATGFGLDLDATVADAISLRITLTGPGTSTPSLLRWRARAYPVAPPVEQWIVPLIIRSHAVVNDSEGQMRSYNVLAEVERIFGLWREKRAIMYSEGQRTYRVRVDNLEMQPTQWRDDSSTFEMTLVVKLISV